MCSSQSSTWGNWCAKVERAVRGRVAVEHLGRVDGYLITPQEICQRVQALLRAGVSHGL
jgi:hypothetical protein